MIISMVMPGGWALVQLLIKKNVRIESDVVMWRMENFP
jgi:hypothetical protein